MMTMHIFQFLFMIHRLWVLRKDPYDIYVHASNIWTQSSDWLITDSNEVIDKLPASYPGALVCLRNRSN